MLDEFSAAWNKHDADSLMSFMTADCIFTTSAGPQVHGERYEHFDMVKAAYESIWMTFPDAQWLEATHFISGNRGVSEWTFRGTSQSGVLVEARGCDLFTFRGGKIHIKDSFRKQRTMP